MLILLCRFMANYIENFKKLGFGIFVHFGLYSHIAMGEWFENAYQTSEEEYKRLTKNFKVNPRWAKELVRTAKKAGAKYICLTTRHHDGFSLYDTKGLSDFDASHLIGRDLVKEFVDECNKQDIIPFFYHTLLDWHKPEYKNDFPKYIDYLVNSIEILCKNYGKIGGFWFDGYWDKPNENWQFDRLYKTIRKYQPEAIITNNTGLSALGEVSHYDIDCVTFERGKPFNVSSNDGKERCGEVCDSLTDHWGYAKNDINIKNVPHIIDELIDCRAHDVNLLLNVGPRENGLLRPIEKDTLLELGKWSKLYLDILRNSKLSNIKSSEGLVFEDGNYYYLILNNIPMTANENVARKQNPLTVELSTDLRVVEARYIGDKAKVIKHKNVIQIKPFDYGYSLYTRVIRFRLK